jgi:hypothetical protein
VRIRRYCLALLTAQAAFGSVYSTNRDGSVLYFSSSFRLKDTQQYFHPKIFVWEEGKGLRLYEQRPAEVPTPTAAIPCPDTGFYSMDSVDISADGSVVVTGASRPFIFQCSRQELFQTAIHAGDAVTRCSTVRSVRSSRAHQAVSRTCWWTSPRDNGRNIRGGA